MKNYITFDLNENQKIVFVLKCHLDQICRYESADVFFQDDSKKYKLYSNQFVGEVIKDLRFLLCFSLKFQMPLHKSIKENLGYMLNEYMRNLPDERDKKRFVEKDDCWVGFDYLLCSTQEQDSWIYNKGKKVLFEITPHYKWHFSESKKSKSYIDYDDFAKNYKPCLVTEVEWSYGYHSFRKAKAVYDLIEANDAVCDISKYGVFEISEDELDKLDTAVIPGPSRNMKFEE